MRQEVRSRSLKVPLGLSLISMGQQRVVLLRLEACLLTLRLA